jgi:hypothetical protein
VIIDTTLSFPEKFDLQPILTPGEPIQAELLNAGCRGGLETGCPDFFLG